MSKHTQAVIATFVMVPFAFGSFPATKTVSTSVTVPPPPLPSQSNDDEPSDKVQTASPPNLKGLDAETRTQFMKLVEDHRVAMKVWQLERDTVPALEDKKKKVEA